MELIFFVAAPTSFCKHDRRRHWPDVGAWACAGFTLAADNYATHKHPAVQAWLLKHPRFNMHFTPTSASWLNMVERFFRDITVNRLRLGVFTSVSELTAAIDEYIAHHNTNPKPFIWTKTAADILQKVIRANSRLSSKQNATLY